MYYYYLQFLSLGFKWSDKFWCNVSVRKFTLSSNNNNKSSSNFHNLTFIVVTDLWCQCILILVKYLKNINMINVDVSSISW
jgi:hypothetical protein